MTVEIESWNVLKMRNEIRKLGAQKRKSIFFAFLSAVSFGLASFFLSAGITGFAVLSIGRSQSNLIGAVLFFAGLALAWKYFR